MKNAHDIIVSLQHKPQFKKILHYKCIDKLMSTILPAIRRSVKHGYIHKNILYITITAALNKYDKDNIIKTIKTVLNSKMILESDRFVSCNDVIIEDVILYIDHKPQKEHQLYTSSSHNIHYKERASGEIEISIEDEKLKEVAQTIQEIIKSGKDDPT